MKEESCVKPQVVGSENKQKIGTAILLFIFWMIMTGGETEPKFVLYGVVTAAVVTWLTYPLLLVPNQDGTKLYYLFNFPALKFVNYFFWLMWQLLLANLDVLLATTAQDMMSKIDPKVIRFKFHADNPMAHVVLANSITLTPGTVTLNVTDDGLYEIHALTPGAAEGCLDGGMQKKVAWLFDEKFEFEAVQDKEAVE